MNQKQDNTKKIPLYENFTKLRKLKGYSQDCVATYLGISQNAYSKYERGVNDLASENLIKLFELYGTDLNSVLEELIVKS